jgi:hypothetical protein
MIKNSNPVALAAAAIAISSILALAVLSPVSASNASYGASSGYFPDQYVNQAKEIEPMPNTDGDTGLSKTFPAIDPADWIDSTPEIYS